MKTTTTIFDDLLLPPFNYLCIVEYSKVRTLEYHQHAFFQLVMGLQGVLTFQDPSLQRLNIGLGDILIIPPGKKHYWEVTENPCRTIQLHHDMLQIDRYSELAITFSDIKSDWRKISVESKQYQHLVQDIENEFQSTNYGRSLIIHSRIIEILTLAIREMKECKNHTSSCSQEAVSRALAYIEQHFQKKITLKELASNSYLGVSRFSQLFREYIGTSPGTYINNYRIEKAKVLLCYSRMTVTEVSDYLGFQSIHYFSKLFKKQTGVNPSEFSHKKLIQK